MRASRCTVKLFPRHLSSSLIRTCGKTRRFSHAWHTCWIRARSKRATCRIQSTSAVPLQAWTSLMSAFNVLLFMVVEIAGSCAIRLSSGMEAQTRSIVPGRTTRAYVGRRRFCSRFERRYLLCSALPRSFHSYLYTLNSDNTLLCREWIVCRITVPAVLEAVSRLLSGLLGSCRIKI